MRGYDHYQADLFDRTSVAAYPARPGAKGGATSSEAADAIAVSVPRLRAIALHMLCQHGNLTADEIAHKAGLNILAIRPRVSELRKLGAIVATECRRPNASGHRAIVWRLARGAP